MKNATKHADDLKALHKKLLKEGKPDPKPQMEPVDALVRGAMCADISDARAEEIMKMIARDFVDLNELRVATDLEIQEMLGSKYPDIETRVAMITLCLNDIFEREHTLNLERLKTVSKRDARQFVRELPDISPFVEAYVMLMSMDAPAMPVDDEILEYLQSVGIFDEETKHEEAQKFIEHHLKAEDIYDFFMVVRRAAQSDAKKKVKS